MAAWIEPELPACSASARKSLRAMMMEVFAFGTSKQACIFRHFRAFSGALTGVQDSFSVKNGPDNNEYATCMQIRDPRLVVGTDKGRVHIWQHVSSSFTLQGRWDAKLGFIRDVYFDEDYVIMLPACDSKPVKIRYFNGLLCRSISMPRTAYCMALDEKHLVIVDNDEYNATLRVWNMRTRKTSTKLEGHQDFIYYVHCHDGVIASRDCKGMVIIWSIQAALEGRQAKLASFTDSNFVLHGEHPMSHIRMGENFVVAPFWGHGFRRGIVVTHFPY